MKRASIMKVGRQGDTGKIEFLRNLRDDSKLGKSGSGLLPIDVKAVPVGIGDRLFQHRQDYFACLLQSLPILRQGFRSGLLWPLQAAYRRPPPKLHALTTP